jgi:calcineurin-like phosphoesterase family protein
MVYFTSDTHLGHKAIIKYRPQFGTVEEHDDYIINMILSLGKRDVLLLLGDFLFDGPHYEEYVQRLSQAKCRIKLVMGNHDSRKLYDESFVEMQLPLFCYKSMWISHCPIHPKEIRDRIGNIHGHLHGGIIPDSRYFNVNLDNNNFEFVKLDTIKQYYKEYNEYNSN